MPQHVSRQNPQIDFIALRQMVSIEQVLELMKFEPVERKGDQLRGPCPLHGSTTPKSRSLSVSLSRNAFQCFGCGKKGNALDLAAEYFQLPIYRASLKLCEQLGLEPPRVR